MLRRRDNHLLAVAALVVGIPLWFAWEYARPTWTTGVITGTEVRRSDPDVLGNTTDVQYIYMRNRSDRGLELTNDDSWWWLKRNSERVFNDAKTADTRQTEMTLMWNRWRSTLFSWYPNVIAIGLPRTGAAFVFARYADRLRACLDGRTESLSEAIDTTTASSAQDTTGLAANRFSCAAILGRADRELLHS